VTNYATTRLSTTKEGRVWGNLNSYELHNLQYLINVIDKIKANEIVGHVAHMGRMGIA
jgi:hypothetical protein